VVRRIEVRQPREHDLIGRRFPLAGFGTGFEGSVSWRRYEVACGDTLSAIARDQGQDTRVGDVVEADRDNRNGPRPDRPRTGPPRSAPL